MKYNKGHNASAFYRGAFVGRINMWIGIFDDSLLYDNTIRPFNIKRSIVDDWKVAYRVRIRPWWGEDDHEV